MMQFHDFIERRRVPALYVNTYGSLYRIDENTLKETLCATLPNARGNLETIAVAHLIWPTRSWLQTGYLVRYARREYERTGGFLRIQ
jgi:hypothetical protein